MSVIIDNIIDFVYPKKCLVCGKNDTFLCESCLEKLEYSEQICPNCGEPSAMGWSHKKCVGKNGLDGLVAVYDYQDENVRKLIEEIKFGFNKKLIGMVLDKCEIEMGIVFDLVVPVPLHFYRENWRGFNQAEEMAYIVSKRSQTDTKNVLVKNKATKQQSMSKSREERNKNIQGVFSLKQNENVSRNKILLVDDVFTSGATMKEACKELKKAGCSVVWGFCLAH